jgi:glutathione peroxidase
MPGHSGFFTGDREMMRKLAAALAVISLVYTASNALAAEDAKASALKFKMKKLDGKEFDLAKYKGKVLLVVNVASECGLTPQYEQLQAVYKKYRDKGLVVVGFPCNQFGSQEPGSAAEIREFCTENYGVTFDMFDKVEVNGDNACDLYKYLTSLDTKPQGAGKISWNFEKFLIGRDGEVIARFSPRIKPDADEVIKAIEDALASQ